MISAPHPATSKSTITPRCVWEVRRSHTDELRDFSRRMQRREKKGSILGSFCSHSRGGCAKVPGCTPRAKFKTDRSMHPIRKNAKVKPDMDPDGDRKWDGYGDMAPMILSELHATIKSKKSRSAYNSDKFASVPLLNS